jgi:hypothetical protein
MRIALCLYGLTGSSTNKWGLGKPLDPSMACKFFFKNLINANPNDKIDIFIHSQSYEFKKKLVSIYRPKLSIIEKQKKFTHAINHPSTKYSLSLTVFFIELVKFFYTFKSPFFLRKIRILKLTHNYSRWYSVKMSVNLKKKYEKKNNFKYDMVFLGRMDMAILSPFRINTFSRSKLTISHSNYFPTNNVKDPNAKPSKKNNKDSGIYDFWFIGPSHIINKLSLYYDRIAKYNINPHFGVLEHCAHIGIKITKKMYRWIDYELLRVKIFNSKNY